MNIPQDILEIKNKFTTAGKELFLVGGCVRDFVMGVEPKDFDIVTNAFVDEMAEILSGYEINKDGALFGSLKVRKPGSSEYYEITTYREDLSVGRHPNIKIGVSLEEDSKRRDFTINSLYYDIDNGNVIDFNDGLEDIEAKAIKTIRPASLVFAQDRLRVLRAIRFKAQIGGKYHPQVFAAIVEDNNLSELKQHRIMQEFYKGIKQSISVVEYLSDLKSFGMLEQIFKGNYSWGHMVESRIPEIVIARLLTIMKFFLPDSKSRIISKLVQECLIDSKTAEGIVLLFELEKVNGNTAFQLEKERKKTNITKENIIEFNEHLKSIGNISNFKNINAFSKYELSIDGNELKKKGFSGVNIGIEIQRLEKENFLKI